MRRLPAKSEKDGLRMWIALALLCAAPYLSSSAIATNVGWRAISREANIQFSDKDYVKAVHGYTIAIQTLQKQKPVPESVYDLQLNLAETHRMGGDRSSAQRILDTVGPAILSRRCEDPLLPARYWRRHASLMLDFQNGPAYASSYSKALHIATDNLPDEYRPLVTDKLFFLSSLCRMTMFDYAMPLAVELKATKPASNDEAERITKALRAASVGAEKEVQHQLAAKDGTYPRDALRLLVLTAADNSKESLVAHLMLAKQSYFDGQIQEARSHENAARALLGYKDKMVTELLDDYTWFCFERGAARLAKEQTGPPTEQFFRAACDFHPTLSKSSSREEINSSLDRIALYKMNLARVLNVLGRVEESVSTIDSIPKAALNRQNETYWHRFGRVNCLIAQNQVRRGAVAAAKERFHKVVTISALIKDPVRSRDLKAHMQECRRGIE